MCSIERRRTEVQELIRAQERAATGQAEELLRQLEREIAELKKRDTDLGQLVQAEDHISFLQVASLTCLMAGQKAVPKWKWVWEAPQRCVLHHVHEIWSKNLETNIRILRDYSLWNLKLKGRFWPK